MKPLIFATGNKHKAQEISAMLAEFKIKIKTNKINFFEPDYSNLKKVACEKAQQAFEKFRLPLIVEDTGVYFKAYDNFPGNLAKRVYKAIGFNGLLALIKAGKTRKAFFKTIICFTPDGKKFKCFQGILNGTLLDHTVALQKDRLPYEKIFIPKNQTKALAEIPKHEKNKISHRAKATKKLAKWLKKKPIKY